MNFFELENNCFVNLDYVTNVYFNDDEFLIVLYVSKQVDNTLYRIDKKYKIGYEYVKKVVELKRALKCLV